MTENPRALRALEMIEAWGLDPQDPIRQFVDGSSYAIPEYLSPEDYVDEELRDERDRLEDRLNESWHPDDMDFVWAMRGLQAEAAKSKPDPEGIRVALRRLQQDGDWSEPPPTSAPEWAKEVREVVAHLQRHRSRKGPAIAKLLALLHGMEA